MGKKISKNYQFRIHPENDKDIIEFLEKQQNTTLILKIILRQLIKKYGYTDITRHLLIEDIGL